MHRLSTSEAVEDQTNAGLLRNYVQQAEVAKMLADNNLKLMPDKDRTQALQCIEDAGQSLPPSLRSKLVERACVAQCKGKKFEELLDTINPFGGDCRWSSQCPKLRAIGGQEGTILSTFESIYFRAVLQLGIQAGESGAHDLEIFCDHAVRTLSEVDVMDFTDRAALVLSEALQIMRCMLALLDDDLNINYKVCQCPTPPEMGSRVVD